MTANSGMPSSASSASKIKSISASPLAGRIQRERVTHESPAHQREANRNDHEHCPAGNVEKRQVVHAHLELDQADAGRRQRDADQRAMDLLTALICLTLAAASVSLIQLEMSMNDLAFLNVPRWAVLMIIPVGFALMGSRFMRHAFALYPSRKRGR